MTSAIFPSNPILNQKFPVTNPKWEWNGFKWRLIKLSNIYTWDSIILNAKVNIISILGTDSSGNSNRVTYEYELNNVKYYRILIPNIGEEIRENNKDTGTIIVTKSYYITN